MSTWKLKVIRQKRGTKEETSFNINNFETFEAAEEVAKKMEWDINLNDKGLVVVLGPNNQRVVFNAMDFRLYFIDEIKPESEVKSSYSNRFVI